MSLLLHDNLIFFLLLKKNIYMYIKCPQLSASQLVPVTINKWTVTVWDLCFYFFEDVDNLSSLKKYTL
jgi:hypothetical protein